MDQTLTGRARPAPLPLTHIYTAADLADLLGTTVGGIHCRRCRGALPPPFAQRPSLRWLASDIDAWIAASKRGLAKSRRGRPRKTAAGAQ